MVIQLNKSRHWLKYATRAVVAFICTSLFACSGDSSDQRVEQAAEASYLLPQLRYQMPLSIQFSHLGYHLALDNRDGQWWLGGDFQFPAENALVDSLIDHLVNAQIGAELAVTDEQLIELGLSDTSKDKLHMTYDDASELDIIFGVRDYPRDTSDLAFFGEGFSARRYLLLSKTVNGLQHQAVYWIPDSMVALPLSAEAWTQYGSIRLPALRSVSLSVDKKPVYTVSRNTPFGRLYQHKPGDKVVEVGSSHIACLEAFFRQGKNNGIGQLDAIKTTNWGEATAMLSVKDFLGGRYDITLGMRKTPTPEQIAAAQQLAGAVHSGLAPTEIPMLINASFDNRAVPELAQPLAEANKALSRLLKDRVVLAQWDDLSCLPGVEAWL